MNMMKVYQTYILLILSLLTCQPAAAQTTPATHAESMSKVWKGMNVDDVVGHDEYATTGKKFYLYNVGTGRFVIEGGNWGMEGRLFHESFGRPMFLMKSGQIKSGITEATNAVKDVFGCNVPGVSRTNAKWSDYNSYSFTVMMDAYNTYVGPWHFQRVTDDTENYTYYMWETMTSANNNAHENNIGEHNYYLGAAWGEWHVPVDQPDGKGDGYFIHLDDDRSCWTTTEVINNQEKKKVNGDMIPIDKLYQWRLVSEEEFLEELKSEKVGLNPSISSLVPDRDFTRNANGFDDTWVMEEKEGHTYGATGRRGFTYGRYKNNAAQEKYYLDEAWDKPVRLKVTFDNMKNAKYGFLFFEGIGRTYTEFEAPRAGWYLVQCYGFVKSDGNNDAYLFAKVKDSDIEGPEGGESRHDLVKVDKGKFWSKNQSGNCLKVGEELLKNGEAYKNFTWIYLTDEQFANDQKTIQVGVGKDEAFIRSDKVDGTTYYYDGDWVCIDDIRVSYMGLGPCFFYEDEEDLNYLIFDPNNIAQFPSAVPSGRYSGATCLERGEKGLKKDQWNSFSFPIPLTGEQMRNAFGEEAKLAELNSLGGISGYSNVIDFLTVDLRTTDNVVEPGKFYLLKPTVGPLLGQDPKGRDREYYELGRNFFSINSVEENYNHPLMSVETLMEENNDFGGEMTSTVNYVQTPGYDSFAVSGGSYSGSVAVGNKAVYVPKGSYAVSNNTIVHLKRDNPIRGFRGWITLAESLESKEMSLYVGGINDGECLPTLVEELTGSAPRTANQNVYDLYGRKVGTEDTSLPKGMYIVGGKKKLVR